jgi:tetratricopeptide (TPR) repeat protein
MNKFLRFFVSFLAIFILALITYSNSFHNSFHFDDAAFVVENPDIRYITDIKSIFSAVLPAPSRAVGFFAFAFDYLFHQTDVFWYHVTNFTIHILVSWLVFIFCRQMIIAFGSEDTRRYEWSVPLITALLFAVHPVNTQAVTYISQRFQSLTVLFYLSAIISYVNCRIFSDKIWKAAVWFVLFIGFALLAIFTKEIACTIPIMALLIEFFLVRQSDRENVLKKNKTSQIAFYVVLLVTSVILIAVLANVMKAKNWIFFQPRRSLSHTGDILTLPRYIFTELRVFVRYWQLIFFPSGLNLDYDFPMSNNILDVRTFGSIAVLALIFAAAVRLVKYDRLAAFGILWFFAAAVSELVPREHVIWEHKLYLLGIGPLLAAVILTGRVISRKEVRYGLLSLVIILFAALAYQRNKVWKDDISLWSDVVKKSPNKARCFINLGNAYLDGGFPDEAIKNYGRAIELEPYHYKAYFNRGVMHERKQDYQNAIADYTRTIIIKPNYDKAYSNRGFIYKLINDQEKALADYNKAIELNPRNENALSNRGTLYKNTGQLDKALADFNKVVEVNPYFYIPYNNRGLIYKQKQLFDMAEKDFKHAIELNPGDWVPYRNLALTYLDQRKYAEAANALAQAAKITPDNPDILYIVAIIKEKQGDQSGAIEIFKKVVALDPKHAEAYGNMGIIYRARGEYQKALELFNHALSLKNDIDNVLSNRGVIYRLAKRNDLAMADFKKALEINPHNAEALANRGLIYKEQNDLTNALLDLTQAINIVPEIAALYINRSYIYNEIGNYEAAFNDAKRSRELGQAVDENYLKQLETRIGLHK